MIVILWEALTARQVVTTMAGKTALPRSVPSCQVFVFPKAVMVQKQELVIES